MLFKSRMKHMAGMKMEINFRLRKGKRFVV